MTSPVASRALVGVLSSTFLGALGALGACGDAGSGGGGGADTTSGQDSCYPAGRGSGPARRCFQWPPPSTTAAGSGSSTGGGTSTASVASGATVGTSSGNGSSGTGGNDGGCPDAIDAMSMGLLPVTICGSAGLDPMSMPGECCYDYAYSCCSGRPFLVGGAARTAPLRVAASGWTVDTSRPLVDRLDHATRTLLADAWLKDALMEHASIASFGRFALELMAVGAPPELIDAAHEAARDEIRHARACFALASAYAGSDLGPGKLGFGGAVEVSCDLAAIAARAVVEGCVGETLAAVQAAEQLAVATDPAVRATLTGIVEDESRHATLAFRFVAWAVRTGGAKVARAVDDAFARARASVEAGIDETALPNAARAHGRVGGDVLRVAFEATWIEAITPAARALSGASAHRGAASS